MPATEPESADRGDHRAHREPPLFQEEQVIPSDLVDTSCDHSYTATPRSAARRPPRQRLRSSREVLTGLSAALETLSTTESGFEWWARLVGARAVHPHKYANCIAFEYCFRNGRELQR
jgi:hypothetical protein